MKVIKILSIVVLTLSILLFVLAVLGSSKVLDLSPSPFTYISSVLCAAASVISLVRQKNMEKAGVQTKSSPALIVLSVICTVVLVLVFVFTINKYYGFTAEGAASKGPGGGTGELLYSRSLSDEYSVFVFSPGERYETVLVKKGAFLWNVCAYSEISVQDGDIQLLSFTSWPVPDGQSTFIALECRDERAAYAEIGAYRVEIEDEITALTVPEELEPDDIEGKVFGENGELLYRLSLELGQPGKYAVPVWEAA